MIPGRHGDRQRLVTFGETVALIERNIQFTIVPRTGGILPGHIHDALTIDGQRRSWWGATHKLEVGRSYTFGFVPPNEECCVGSSRVVAIPEGEGEFGVEGKISFKDATLATSQIPSGSSVSCGLFGMVTAPAALRVPMAEGQATIQCQVATPAGKTGTIQVSLRPGKTAQLRWP